MDIVFLDSETTGIPAAEHEVLSVCLIDLAGRVLLDTLVRPVRHTSWPGAEAIHGISPQLLKSTPDLPTLQQLSPRIAALLHGRHLVIYNAGYDTVLLEEALQLGPPARIECLMEAFAAHYCQLDPIRGGYKRQSLSRAAGHVLHDWPYGPAHSAKADCFAARAVWRYLNEPAERQHQAERLRGQEAMRSIAAPAIPVGAPGSAAA